MILVLLKAVKARMLRKKGMHFILCNDGSVCVRSVALNKYDIFIFPTANFVHEKVSKLTGSCDESASGNTETSKSKFE